LSYCPRRFLRALPDRRHGHGVPAHGERVEATTAGVYVVVLAGVEPSETQ